MVATGAEFLGLFELAAQEKDERHNQTAKQERNTPPPFANGTLFQHHIQRKAHRRRDHNGDLLATRLPAGVETLAARRGDLRQINRNPAQLGACRKALQQAAGQHQQRRPQANALIRRDQHNQKGSGGHNRQGDDQPFTATHFINVSPQHNGPDRTHQKARAKDGEGHHQRRKFTACREERVGDVGGIKAEQKEVELLKKVARRDAENRARFRTNRCR